MAKLAEDNWVTAMAWRQQIAANNARPEGPTDISDRWTSARATARQARRINSTSGSGDSLVTPAGTARRGTAGGGGGGGSGWARPAAVVVIGDAGSARSEEGEDEEDEEARVALASGRRSGGFSL